MPSRREPCIEAGELGLGVICGDATKGFLNAESILDRTSGATSRSPRAKWKLSIGELQSMQDIFFSPTMLRVPVKHEEQKMCEQGDRTIIRDELEGCLSHTEQAELRSHRSGAGQD